MQIKKSLIAEHNDLDIAEHQRRFEWASTHIDHCDSIVEKVAAFQITIPSWALGTGGTRFARFAGAGEPRTLLEKIDDVGLLHAISRSCGSISLHIPWDSVDDAPAVRTRAISLGLQFDAVNSNTFQDQPSQPLSYKFGSLSHVDKAVRNQAVEHNIETIRQGELVGSKALTLWLSDGSCFPGQINFRRSFERTLESMKQIYRALPADWNMYIEYKAFEPNMYSTTVGDWGYSHMFASKLGKQALTLVDLGHHLPSTNIEQIVAILLMEGKLAGFHFNDSKYGDDDLTVGSINPYQLFLVFCELVRGMDEQKMNHARDLGWMIDASHNVKDPLEDLLQSVEAIQIAYAQALIVDSVALAQAQESNDPVAAQEVLQAAFRTDVRPIVAEARRRAGGALRPISIFRSMNVRANLIAERGSITRSTGL
ncbi:MAG: sugar isomerase [Planctomycetota bacterium]